VFVDQARSEMTVRGHARMKLPRGDMKTGAIPQGGMAATADKIVTITSDEYVVKSGRAAFRGHVRIEDAQMQIASDLLTADSLAGGEQIERITAERNVVADLKDSNGTNTHVTADRALYTVSDSFLRLTGSPVVQNERGTLTGSIIVWDRAYDLLIVRNQKMVFQASGSEEEAFPSFQSKAKK
jgi:lipopolysaccharide transport protein LptA